MMASKPLKRSLRKLTIWSGVDVEEMRVKPRMSLE